jgi:hypothetical protein
MTKRRRTARRQQQQEIVRDLGFAAFGTGELAGLLLLEPVAVTKPTFKLVWPRAQTQLK